MRAHQVWVDRQRPLGMDRRLLLAAGEVVERAEIGVGLGAGGVQLQHPVQVRGGLARPLQFDQGDAEIEVRVAAVRVELQGVLEGVRRAAGIMQPAQSRAERQPSVAQVRIDGERTQGGELRRLRLD